MNIETPPRSALLREAFTAVELPRLLLQAPQLALAPRGRGERILVWPGYGAGDASTAFLRSYLAFLGYNTRGWMLGQNSGDVLELLDTLRENVLRAAGNAPVTIIGWSLGGYLAREVARDCPEAVDHVVTMGSPVVGGPKYTAVANMFGQGSELDAIEMAVEARYARPLTVPVTAIYSKLDGVVAWEACIDHRSPNVEHVEVSSSHTGLGFSPSVLRVIADRLSRAPNPATASTPAS